MSIIFTDKHFDVLKKVKLQDFKYFVGFYELDNHWRLIFPDKVSKLFFYIDPFVASRTQHQTCLTKWKVFASFRPDSKDIDWKIALFEHSKQSDLINCGLICLLIFDYIVQKKSSCDLSSEDLINYRNSLLKLLDTYETKKSKTKCYNYWRKKCYKYGFVIFIMQLFNIFLSFSFVLFLPLGLNIFHL